MKQRILILAAATAVVFAACNGGGTEGSYSKEQLDSITKVKTDSIANALKAGNDSLINAKAAAEARTADSLRVIDSIITATKKSATTTSTVKKNTKPTTKPTKPSKGDLGEVTPAPPPPTKTKQDEKFEQRESGNKTISEQKKQEQEDKFKRRGGN
jgi:hypothetical protein